MGASHNKAIVREYFEKMAAGDPSVPDLLADDVCWWVPPASELGGVYEGRDAVLELMAGGTGLYDPSTPLVVQIEQMVAEDDWVCVQAVIEARTARGEDYRNHYHFAFQLSEGKLVQVREYVDTLYAHEKLFS